MFFRFLGSSAVQNSVVRPKKVPEAPEELQNLKKMYPKTDPMFYEFLKHFWGPKIAQNRVQKVTKHVPRFATACPASQRSGRCQNQFFARLRKGAGWLEIYPAKEREGMMHVHVYMGQFCTASPPPVCV